jgi:hypothetical protein
MSVSYPHSGRWRDAVPCSPSLVRVTAVTPQERRIVTAECLVETSPKSPTPYGLPVIDSCLTCVGRPALLRAISQRAFRVEWPPPDCVLPPGRFAVCRGRASPGSVYRVCRHGETGRHRPGRQERHFQRGHAGRGHGSELRSSAPALSDVSTDPGAFGGQHGWWRGVYGFSAPQQ